MWQIFCTKQLCSQSKLTCISDCSQFHTRWPLTSVPCEDSNSRAHVVVGYTETDILKNVVTFFKFTDIKITVFQNNKKRESSDDDTQVETQWEYPATVSFKKTGFVSQTWLSFVKICESTPEQKQNMVRENKSSIDFGQKEKVQHSKSNLH